MIRSNLIFVVGCSDFVWNPSSSISRLGEKAAWLMRSTVRRHPSLEARLAGSYLVSAPLCLGWKSLPLQWKHSSLRRIYWSRLWPICPGVRCKGLNSGWGVYFSRGDKVTDEKLFPERLLWESWPLIQPRLEHLNLDSVCTDRWVFMWCCPLQ